MRSVIFIATAMALFGCNSAFAQVGPTPPRSAALLNMTSPTGLGNGIPIPTVGANSRNALGTIQLNLGTLGPVPGSTIGTIMACPTTGIAAPTPSSMLDASNAVGVTGTLSPQLPPGATSSAISSFGTSTTTAACDPAAAALEAAEAAGNSVASPIPGLANITGPAFSDATIPSAATEAGAAGLSPEIVVPTPDSSATP